MWRPRGQKEAGWPGQGQVRGAEHSSSHHSSELRAEATREGNLAFHLTSWHLIEHLLCTLFSTERIACVSHLML